MRAAIDNQIASKTGLQGNQNPTGLKEIFDLPVDICLGDYRKRLHGVDPTQQVHVNLNLEQLKEELKIKSSKLAGIDFTVMQDLQQRELLSLSEEEKLILARIKTTSIEIDAALKSKESEYDQSALAVTFLSLVTTTDRFLQWFTDGKLDARITEAEQKLSQQQINESQIMNGLDNYEILDLYKEMIFQASPLKGLTGSKLKSSSSVNLNSTSREKSFIGKLSGDVAPDDFFIYGTSYVSGPKGERTNFIFEPKEISAQHLLPKENNVFSLLNEQINKSSDKSIEVSIPIGSLREDEYLPLPTKLGYRAGLLIYLPPNINAEKVKFFRDALGITYISGLGPEFIGKTVRYYLINTVPDDNIDCNRPEFTQLDPENQATKIFPANSHFTKLLQSTDTLSKVDLLQDYIVYRKGIYYDDPVLDRLLVECPNYLAAMDQVGYVGTCSHHQQVQEILFKQNGTPCCGIKGFVVAEDNNGSLAFLANETHVKTWVPSLPRDIQEIEPTKDLSSNQDFNKSKYQEALNRLALALGAFKQGNVCKEFLEERLTDIARLIQPHQRFMHPKTFMYCHALDSFFAEFNNDQPRANLLWFFFCDLKAYAFGDSDPIFYGADLKLSYDFSLAKLAAKIIDLSKKHPELGIDPKIYYQYISGLNPDQLVTYTPVYWKFKVRECVRFGKPLELDASARAALKKALKQGDSEFRNFMFAKLVELFFCKAFHDCLLENKIYTNFLHESQKLIKQFQDCGFDEQYIKTKTDGTLAFTNDALENFAVMFNANDFIDAPLGLFNLGLRNLDFDSADDLKNLYQAGRFYKINAEGNLDLQSNLSLFLEQGYPNTETILASQIYQAGLLPEELKTNADNSLAARLNLPLFASNLICYDKKSLLKLVEQLEHNSDKPEDLLFCKLATMILKLSTVETEEAQEIQRLPQHVREKIKLSCQFNNFEDLDLLLKLRYGNFQFDLFRQLLLSICFDSSLSASESQIVTAKDPKQILKNLCASSRSLTPINKTIILNLTELLHPDLIKIAFAIKIVTASSPSQIYQDSLGILTCDSPATTIKQGLKLKTTAQDLATLLCDKEFLIEDIHEDDMYKEIFPKIQKFLAQMNNSAKFTSNKVSKLGFVDKSNRGNVLPSKAGLELREYQAGDDDAAIDWNATLRSAIIDPAKIVPKVRIGQFADQKKTNSSKNYLCNLNLFSKDLDESADLIAVFAEIRSRILSNQPVSLAVFAGPIVVLKLSNQELRKIFTDQDFLLGKNNEIARTKLEGLLTALIIYQAGYQCRIPEIFDFKKLTTQELTNLKAFWAKDLANSEVVIVGEQTTELQKQIRQITN